MAGRIPLNWEIFDKQDLDTSLVKALDHPDFLALLRYGAALVGNSSSGIIECPALRVASVQVGERQKGRERGGNVIDCDATTGGIALAIAQARAPAFREGLAGLVNPYAAEGSASKTIFDRLKSEELTARLLKKSFIDIPTEHG